MRCIPSSEHIGDSGQKQRQRNLSAYRASHVTPP
jgi:hypothetical protein